MKRIALLLLVLVLTACSAAPKSELATNREKWEDAGIKNYRMSLHVGCFCGFMDRMPLEIDVRNGEVVSMTYNDGTPVAADDPDIAFFGQFATIDRLFADLETGESSKADELKIEFNPTYGYPQQVWVDRYKDAVDDEYSLEVVSLEPLQ